MSDDSGQALVIAVLLLAVAAVAIGGLRLAQDRILGIARDTRAGEAAVEAAAEVVGDAYAAAAARAVASGAPGPTPRLADALTAAVLAENARVAASDLALRNGGTAVSEVVVRCADGSAEITVLHGARRYRAGFAAPLC